MNMYVYIYTVVIEKKKRFKSVRSVFFFVLSSKHSIHSQVERILLCYEFLRNRHRYDHALTGNTAELLSITATTSIRHFVIVLSIRQYIQDIVNDREDKGRTISVASSMIIVAGGGKG